MAYIAVFSIFSVDIFLQMTLISHLRYFGTDDVFDALAQLMLMSSFSQFCSQFFFKFVTRVPCLSMPLRNQGSLFGVNLRKTIKSFAYPTGLS